MSLPHLLDAHEPPAFQVVEGSPHSPYLLTVDHASRRIPHALGTLGLSDVELETHIAWDIGAAGLSLLLAQRLQAFVILQSYSRLVIDCNRSPSVPSSIVELSEHTHIPGNCGLTDAQRQQRVQEIFNPYHARIERELERRQAQGQRTILIAMHSFTPRFKGVDRPWQFGVLYNRDTRLAHRLLAGLRALDFTVGDNEPYSVSDETDYGIPRYGEQRGNVHVELEVRQDLIANADGQAKVCELLSRVLPEAAAPFV